MFHLIQKIQSISNSTTIILDKATTSNSTTGKLTFVGVSKQGANYNSSGSGTDKTTNIIISRAGGTNVTLPIIVDSTSTDATFDVKLIGEEETNYYTFCFDSDPNLIFGDEFVISNTGTSGNANRYQAIAGKHKVKKIKKSF